MSNHSTIPDPESVITLGQLVNVPLMGPSSELTDGLEPHGHILLQDTATARTGSHAGDGRGCTRGGGWVGTGRGTIPGTNPAIALRPV